MRPTLCAMLLLLALRPHDALAQGQDAYPLSNAAYPQFEGMLHTAGGRFNTSVRPYRISELNTAIPFDSLRAVRWHGGRFSRTWLGRKMLMESLIRVDSAKYQVYFDPVLHMDIGWDPIAGERHALNTRGFMCRGSIGRKVSFFTAFWENQSTFMPYMTDWVNANGVVPGQGRFKPFEHTNFFYRGLGIKVDGFDYLMASGYVSYTPTENFNVQFGNDKHFFGEGYRSMLLSDAAFNYPFLKLSTKFRRWQYVHLLAQLQDTRHPVIFEAGYKKKWASFHYLTAHIGKRWQASLFEGIILTTRDRDGNGGFDWNLLQPLMMVRPIQFQFYESRNNALVGLNLKFVPMDGAALYGQLVFDDLHFGKLGEAGYIGQKLAWQLGFKAYDLLGVKGLHVLAEYNAARPYTYGSTEPMQAYMHFAQPLGHPLGANFHEGVWLIAYRWRDLRFEFRTSYAQVGRDYPITLEDGTTQHLHFGADTYRSEQEAFHGPGSAGNSIGQGLLTSLLYQNLEAAWTVNRATNFTVRLGLAHRLATDRFGTEQNLMPYFGIRTDIRNLYYDF